MNVSTAKSDFIVRPYRQSDGASCAGIFSRGWHFGHAYAPRSIGIAEFKEETKDRTLLVAETREGSIVGFAAVVVADRFVHHLYVEPAYVGRGIGRSLLKEALVLAGGQATLKCQVRNTGAIAFYRHEGWTPEETGEADGETWVRMHSPIPN